MIDWLEELLSTAEQQAEPEEERDLLSLRFLTAGAVLRAARDTDPMEQGGAFSERVPGYRNKAAASASLTAASAKRAGSALAGGWSALDTAVDSPGEAGFDAEEAPMDSAAEKSLSSGEFEEWTLPRSLMGLRLLPQTGALKDLVRRTYPGKQVENGGLSLNRPGPGSGLRMLYRRAGEAVRSAIVPVAASSGITVFQDSSGAAAGLTAEELDRAVRRDSRRYDGGMSIY